MTRCHGVTKQHEGDQSLHRVTRFWFQAAFSVRILNLLHVLYANLSRNIPFPEAGTCIFHKAPYNSTPHPKCPFLNKKLHSSSKAYSKRKNNVVQENIYDRSASKPCFRQTKEQVILDMDSFQNLNYMKFLISKSSTFHFSDKSQNAQD